MPAEFGESMIRFYPFTKIFKELKGPKIWMFNPNISELIQISGHYTWLFCFSPILDLSFHLHSLPSFPPSVSYLSHSLPPIRPKVESVSFLLQLIKRDTLLLDKRSSLTHVYPSAFLYSVILEHPQLKALLCTHHRASPPTSIFTHLALP